MNAEFWRDRISSRSDLVARITHLTKGDTDDEAFERLWKILLEKTLIASGNEGYIVGDKKAVCFQEVPLYAIAENLIFEDALEGKNRYSHFGLRFNKIWMFRLGARPVIYGKTEELKRMLPKDEYWRIVNQDLDSENVVDWSHEREWRHVSDYHFEYSDTEILVKDKNRDFRLYRILSREYLNGRTIDENEKIRKSNIAEEFDSYSIENYIELFKTCNFLHDTIGENNLWSLSRGLDIVFELLELHPDFYVNVLKEYFKSNAPFRLNGYRQVVFLLSNIGYEKTYSLMNGAEYRRKDTWLSLIWECIKERDITDVVIHDYRSFSERTLVGDNPIVPSLTLLAKFGERDSGLRNSILKRIVEKEDLSAAFLKYVFRDEDIIVVLDLFHDDFDTLSQIYMNALEISDHVDYGGKLFIKIYEQRPNIWKEYVDWVKNHSRRDGYEQKIFEMIWTTEKWQECINYAYSVLVDDDKVFFIVYPAQLLFGRAEQESDVVKNRKKQWLLDSLHENSRDVSKCSKLIDVVVNVMPHWKLDFILEYLNDNQNVEDFKKIHLFPMSASWSGSEVPLILDKIQFLQSLKEGLKGAAFIEHREYINEYRRDLEEYKRKVELKEYLEEADYS